MQVHKILILFAHPAFERSMAHKRVLARVRQLADVTVHDLYEAYPDFDIDIQYEQQLLLDHDIIFWQHPVYWYSSPAIIKQWQDLVLVHGWAYGRNGTMLKGKRIANVVTTGGGEHSYSTEGIHGHSLKDFLLPFARTASLCNMAYLPPFVIHGTHSLGATDYDFYAWQYEALCVALRDGTLAEDRIMNAKYLNELVKIPKTV